MSGHAVLIRANVLNLTNVRYWVPNATGTGLSAGAPRTFSVAVQVALNRNGQGNPFAGTSDRGAASDGRAYIGLDAGATLPIAFKAKAINKVDSATAAPVADALRVRQQAAWDVDGILGYDLGRFSAEIEAGFKRYGVGAVHYNDATVPIEVTGLQHGAGTYGNAGGRTGVLSVLFNGLVNIGRRESAWSGFVGGGVGLARVSTGRWTLDADSASLVIGATATAGTNTNKSVARPTYFTDDNATSFAWQAVAGVRHPITRRIDATFKYRYFDVPNLYLRAESGNELRGDLKSHSLLLGFAIHL